MKAHQEGSPLGVTAAARRLFEELAVQDWLVLIYFVVLLVCAGAADPSALRDRCLVGLGSLMAGLVACLLTVRLRIVTGTFWSPFLYRLGVYGSVQASYFFLRDLLPIVNDTRTFDSALYHLDLMFFGFEPALYLQHWVSPLTTEWFSFFYFSYFCLLAFHIFPVLALARDQQLLGEFCFSMLWLFCAGHFLYLLVPGYGPVVALRADFATELPRGLWYDMVMGTVSSAGAQMDIFPSLHTAAPVFFTLFSYRHRDRVPFRFTWPVIGCFSLNIMVATMYLRWHWVIDVVAGVLHAGTAVFLARVLTRHELTRRARLGLTANWPNFASRVRARGSRPSVSPEELRAA